MLRLSLEKAQRNSAESCTISISHIQPATCRLWTGSQSNSQARRQKSLKIFLLTQPSKLVPLIKREKPLLEHSSIFRHFRRRLLISGQQLKLWRKLSAISTKWPKWLTIWFSPGKWKLPLRLMKSWRPSMIQFRFGLLKQHRRPNLFRKQ